MRNKVLLNYIFTRIKVLRNLSFIRIKMFISILCCAHEAFALLTAIPRGS